MASGKNHDLRFAHESESYRAIITTTPILMAAAIASDHADVGLRGSRALFFGFG
jgi:hypothetical protein